MKKFTLICIKNVTINDLTTIQVIPNFMFCNNLYEAILSLPKDEQLIASFSTKQFPNHYTPAISTQPFNPIHFYGLI